MSRAIQSRLNAHVAALIRCTRCPLMHKPVVSGGPILSKVILVGQAPGVREPVVGRPFAWTAGRTLFRWFHEFTGLDESAVRQSIYMAAVCRCFPGKNGAGGDRVPDRGEIENCAPWLDAEIALLRPDLVIPVGKLAIARFLPPAKLDETIGRAFRATRAGCEFDVIPLPHPSGASPWPRMEPGKTLVARALRRIAAHPAFPRPAGAGG